MQKKSSFLNTAIRVGRCRERRYADHIFQIYFSQIFKIFFASGGKGTSTPLTKILPTAWCSSHRIFANELQFNSKIFICVIEYVPSIYFY